MQETGSRRHVVFGRESSHLIADLDGTLIRGREVITGAAELLSLFRGRCTIVSNNSTHSAGGLAAQLHRLGLDIPADRIVLAGMVAVEMVARNHPRSRMFLAGSVDLAEAAENAGLHLVEDGADVVLLGRDRHFNYRKLEKIVNELARGAVLVATNPDVSHPGSQGSIVPETGALLNAVLACVTPRQLTVIGKPEPALFLEALRRLEVEPRACVVIGDNPATDIAGAERLGIPRLLVGPLPFGDVADLSQLMSMLRAESLAFESHGLGKD